ncbi:putative B3 domain-containing protein At5g66980 [Cajanus cajan]|uniref:putative B3 domain-containing protein At5g66980 n=1 Tax=Cajanus cajan TaxID=3821 RepID=UPI00098DB651|nr:putative B3 domain-containing protein At5g66980 [Cajanus cajan]
MESAVPCCGDKSIVQEFFKVFLLQTGSSQLKLPTSFTKFFNGITPCKTILVDHDRNFWDIYLEKIEGRLVFKNGWQQFAKEKGLEEEDFLVFQYDGKSTFNVKIFSRTGCRKVAAPSSCEKIVPSVILNKDSDLRSNKIQRGCKRKHSSPSLKTNEKLVLKESNEKSVLEETDEKSVLEGIRPSEESRCKPTRVAEENDNHHEKKPCLTKCVPLQNPHFQIYFDAAWRLKKVELPRRVLRKMNIKLMPNRIINLRDENDTLWPVIITAGFGDRYFLGSGWSVFQRSNNIQEGQQCDFQFVVDKANVVQEMLVRVHSKCTMSWVDCK